MLPLVKVAEMSQSIDSENFTVLNSLQLAGQRTTTSISANATFEIRSPRLVQVKFEEGFIGTPQLTDSLQIPENVECLGQKIDLTPFKGIINSVQATASFWKISISRSNIAKSWLLTTYLDEELRISKGVGGNVFVLSKEGGFLLPS
ncbi:hypothetical protein Fmac_009279 [Flemingia macrophylla]|uniref:Plastid lipid-associated protein/fibrillin conserved domain-containing protein n=1 Tax=Flemingia macrophylla TaxID=520843 RepID=A0ABD1MZV7_9FABA